MKKKKKNPFLVALSILFIIYLVLFITQSTGYYELKRHNEMILTKESMKRFEKDIENGKDITISSYIEENKKDYTSKMGDLGNKTSSLIEKIMTKGIKSSSKVLVKLLS